MLRTTLACSLLLLCACAKPAPPAAPPPAPALPFDPSQPMPAESLSRGATLTANEWAPAQIDARADLFSAALPVPDKARGGFAPAAITLPRGAKAVSFSDVRGQIGCMLSAAFGADGGGCAGGVTALEPASGISGITVRGRTLFVAGVFLAGGVPEAAPPTLDFSPEASGWDFVSLKPLLSQSFFIGDGLTSTGKAQSFAVPEGATHLYLGFVDGRAFQGRPSHYDDNRGAIALQVRAD